MDDIRISRLAVAHPPYRIAQSEASRRIALYAEDPRRVAALARGTQIVERAIAVPAEDLLELGCAGARNDLYRRIAPGLAHEAVAEVLGGIDSGLAACLVTSSCTGHMSPSWAVGLVESCGLPPDISRVPITEAGCAGGAVAIARAADYMRARGSTAGLAASVELCSLAFHRGGDDGNITSTLIFGDGAGAALLERGEGRGLVIVDSMSMLVPHSEGALAFELTDQGFYPILQRELPEILPEPAAMAVATLLRRNGLDVDDVRAWLIHPGGPRILAALEQRLGISREQTRWSWDSMREFGNTSSAAIFDVLRRYLDEGTAGGYALAAAFGPGVSIELLLLRAT